MSYRDFTFPEVDDSLGLRADQGRLFADVKPLPTRPEFQDFLTAGQRVLNGSSNDLAWGAFLVAPMLVELQRLLPRPPAIFAGVALDVDADHGLSGPCDFILAPQRQQFYLTTPQVVLTTGRPGGRNRGFGPCVAAMRAAWLYRSRGETPATRIDGVLTDGQSWQFFRLQNDEYLIDIEYRAVSDSGRILAILAHMIETA